MMKRSMRKSMWRELRSSFSRFMAIFAITAIGAGFFAGLRATSPDMYATANGYYDDTRLMDFRLVSTMGFTEEDIEALAAREDVDSVMATQGIDLLVEGADGLQAVRVHALPNDTSPENPGYLNRLRITEGRLPEAADECVVDDLTAHRIGDTVQVSRQNTTSALDLVRTRTFTVVGRAASPCYVSFQRGNTNIGSGRLSFFLYVTQDAFDSEYYTEVYITSKDTQDIPSLSAPYEDIIDAQSDALDAFADTRAQVRYDDIYSEASEKLDDARTELAEARADADEQLAKALQKIQDAEKEIADGQREINENAQKLEDAKAQVASGQQQTAEARDTLTTQQAAWDAQDAQVQQLEQGVAALPGAISEMARILPALLAADETELPVFTASAQAAIATARGTAALLDAAGQPGGSGYTQVADTAEAALAAADYATAYGALQMLGQDPLYAGMQQTVGAARAQLDAAKQQLDAGWAQLAGAEAQIGAASAQVTEGEAQLEQARRDIADARVKVADARAEYEEKKAEAEEEFAEAEQNIADGQAELDDLEKPEWYVTDRTANAGYSGFSSDADRIDAIATAIPIFFYLVAALVCLTTMTRMVEEQRTNIGTLKALGFGRWAIAAKFIFYAAFASTVGAVIGVAAGMVLFPSTIWSAYSILYNLPPLSLQSNVGLALLSVFTSVLCTTAATFGACWGELRSVPAQLMRPKAPKAGKRVLLERIPALWSRMKFSQKVTARNLFRYKKRFFMTIVGVAGCTALLLTGFGLRDSITGIVPLQYGGIDRYDMVASLSDPSSAQADTPLNEALPDMGDGLYTMSAPIDAKSDRGDNIGMTTYVYVAEEPERLSEFIHFHTRENQEPIAFPQGDGAVITEKLATRLKVDVGDEFDMWLVNEAPVKVRVAGIMENYVQNYVYLTPDTYQSLFGKAPEYDTLLLRLPENPTMTEGETLAALVETEGVAGAVDITSFSDEITDMLDSLNAVVWLIILSAGALAMVVLYNLTNINITERVREIATLKVLGFYNKEVSNYVYRENILLTLIGTAFGLVLGIFLHQFVITTAEVDVVMFRRVVMPLSYVWSILFTLACAWLVNLIMLPRLRRVDMVESLKSAE